MKKFLVIYHAPAEAVQQMDQTTHEQQQEGINAWMNWAQRTGSQLKDLGAPLTGGQSIDTNGASKPSDKDVRGYSIVEAESMDVAKALFDGHPHLSNWHKGATIELHEVMPIPGM
jgi:hypothetical protein